MGWEALKLWGDEVARIESLAGGVANDVWSVHVNGRLAVGRHPSALLLNASGSQLFVALAGSDQIALVDTHARKIVRRSSVKATLEGPGGSTTLDAGTHDPGTYRFDWTATAVGRWTFSVDAVDDLGRAASSERSFTVGSASTRR